ncbi:MAG: Trk system potassium transporter TrkA [Nitrospinota bacterium]
MRVIVIGAGEVGFHIARRLAEENQDVVLVDKSEAVIESIADKLDALTILGNGANPRALSEAGLKEAKMLIAVSNDDAANLVACHLAAANDVSMKIARVGDPAYFREDLDIEGRDFGADLLINPAQEVAGTIERLIATPGAMETAEFFRGRLQMVGLRVGEGSPISGRSLRSLGDTIRDSGFLVLGLSRNGEVSVPRGNTVVKPHEFLMAIARPDRVPSLMEFCGARDEPFERILIVGGGRVGYFLADRLSTQDLKVKVIESSEERAKVLAQGLPDALILHGDGTDLALLRSEGIEDMDAVVTVSDDEETNLFSALLAKRHGCRKAVAIVNRPDYLSLVFSLGIDAAVSPRLVTASVILRYIRGPNIIAQFTSAFSEAEVVELEVGPKAKVVGRALASVDLPRDALVAGVARGEEVEIPHGGTTIQGGDRVLLFALPQGRREAERLFR